MLGIERFQRMNDKVASILARLISKKLYRLDISMSQLKWAYVASYVSKRALKNYIRKVGYWVIKSINL